MLDNLRIYTTSLLQGTGTELAPPRDQILIPQTEWILAILVFLTLALPLTVWRFWSWGREKVGKALRLYREGVPLRHLLKDLKRLKIKAFGIPGAEFYTLLTQCGRDYLSRRLRRDLRASTTTELAVGLVKELPAEAYRTFIDLFHRADLVRFDRQETEESQKLSDLEFLKALAFTLEKKEGRRVDL